MLLHAKSVKSAVALFVAAAIAIHPYFATGPVWAGEGGKKHDDEQRESKGKGKGHDKQGYRADKGDRDREQARRDEPMRSAGPGHRVFEDRQRVVIHDYYVTEYRSGRCPPGLAKKHNGCMPPGQAKKWQVGRPLPREVVFYDLPPALVVQIGAPPPGYRYVRVAADILMIAIGTGLVIEAITDLGRL